MPSTWRPQIKDLLHQLGLSLLGDSYEIDGLKCELHFLEGVQPDDLQYLSIYKSEIMSVIESEKPDLIWSHYTDFLTSMALLMIDPKKIWIDISDNEFPRLDRLKEFPDLCSVYSKIQTAIVASPFMKQAVQKAFPNIEIRYLPNILENAKVDLSHQSGEYWLFVNPVAVKGVDFVVKLAEKMPQEKFIFVGNWNVEPPKNLPRNIEFLAQQSNLAAVFQKAKALLFPSLWEEAFGRIPLEAMAAGVPVIASDRGALPMTVGSGGQSLPHDIDSWISAMQQITRDAERWRKAGRERFIAYRREVDAAYQALNESLMLK